jgi:hypothetical protein
MVEIPLSQDAWERTASEPVPNADPYNGVPLGMEALIHFLMTRRDPA